MLFIDFVIFVSIALPSYIIVYKFKAAPIGTAYYFYSASIVAFIRRTPALEDCSLRSLNLTS